MVKNYAIEKLWWLLKTTTMQYLSNNQLLYEEKSLDQFKKKNHETKEFKGLAAHIHWPITYSICQALLNSGSQQFLWG